MSKSKKNREEQIVDTKYKNLLDNVEYTNMTERGTTIDFKIPTELVELLKQKIKDAPNNKNAICLEIGLLMNLFGVEYKEIKNISNIPYRLNIYFKRNNINLKVGYRKNKSKDITELKISEFDYTKSNHKFNAKKETEQSATETTEEVTEPEQPTE